MPLQGGGPMRTGEDARRYHENWPEEIDSAAEYRAMAKSEPDASLARVYGNLARMEEAHITFWEDKLRLAGVEVGARRPSWRSRVLGWIARRLGPDLVLATVAAREQADQNYYVTQPETTGTRMPAQERWHAKVLKQLVLTQPRGVQGSFLGRLEGRHRALGGNALRAAVLGANDGLCSNLSLVMGVAGANLAPHAILLTGLAGLLAGACSMALGEWLSVSTTRESYQRQIQTEADELEQVPEEEEAELALIYQAKGLPEEQAKALAQRLIANQETALDTLMREELGIDPEELGGSGPRSQVDAETSGARQKFGAGQLALQIEALGHGQRAPRTAEQHRAPAVEPQAAPVEHKEAVQPLLVEGPVTHRPGVDMDEP